MRVDIGTKQGNCAVGTCSNITLRESGCFICSNGGDGDECVTCLNNHIVFNGRCVGCLGMEDCPFNNSDEVECVDGNDLSHCNQSNNPAGCSDHVCLYGNCSNGIVEGDEECEIGGRGCRGCVCMDGWHSNGTKDCVTECGDGTVAGSEECEIGGSGCDENCSCGDECSCGRGWYSNMSMNCSSVCGDGIWVSDEECDSSAGCGDDCNCSVGWKGNGYGICKEVCGDGVVVGREECDSTPGCNSVHCVCENNHPLNNESGLCMICGNGIVEGSEECDMNDIHCNNQTCKCMSGYSLRNVSSGDGGDGGRMMMICVELKKKNDVTVIVVIVVIMMMIVVVVVVILMIYVVGKKKKNDGGDDDGIEMSLYEVEMERGKRGVLVIGETLYDNATTLVYKGVVDGKKDVVVKVMKMWGSKLDSGQAREMELMRRLKSDYVVMYYGTSVISGRVGIVMEYMPLGSLERLMSVCVMSGELKVRYVREICCGMMYLHSMKMIHRDLKPSNVLVVGDDVGWSGVICKISDFGTAREMDISTTMSMSQSMTMTSNIGTPLYMAPEILSGVGHYSQKSDVYSYGVLMVSLWNQKPPYSEMSGIEVGDLLSGITNRGVRPGIESGCPQSYFNLAHACMVGESHSRPSFSEIWKNVFDS